MEAPKTPNPAFDIVFQNEVTHDVPQVQYALLNIYHRKTYKRLWVVSEFNLIDWVEEVVIPEIRALGLNSFLAYSSDSNPAAFHRKMRRLIRDAAKKAGFDTKPPHGSWYTTEDVPSLKLPKVFRVEAVRPAENGVVHNYWWTVEVQCAKCEQCGAYGVENYISDSYEDGTVPKGYIHACATVCPKCFLKP